MSRLESAIYPFPTSQQSASSCNNVSGLWTPCTCVLEMCIGWYPCGLKFCKGKIDNGIGNSASYRCGIRTCRKCYHFTYHVQQKQHCLWYDWPFDPPLMQVLSVNEPIQSAKESAEMMLRWIYSTGI